MKHLIKVEKLWRSCNQEINVYFLGMRVYHHINIEINDEVQKYINNKRTLVNPISKN